MSITPGFRFGSLLCSLFAFSLPLVGFDISETADAVTISGGHSALTLSLTGGKLSEYAYRHSEAEGWTRLPLEIFGRQRHYRGRLADTVSETPVLRFVEFEDRLIVKCEVRRNGLFWNLWFQLSEDSPIIEGGRFVYGESLGLILEGVGLVFDLPGFEMSAETQTYEELGGTYDNGFIDFTRGDEGIRIYLSNLSDHTLEMEGGTAVAWYRPESTEWETKIDYRRFQLVPRPELGGLDTRFGRPLVFDHDLSNVELAGACFQRERNASGQVRDWFNPAAYSNGFIKGSGGTTRTKTGYWRDDWTTGALLRQLKLTFDVTRNPYYFMRFIDILDYQIDREETRLKEQWGINQHWQENYPMGRVEAAMDAYDLSGWEYYADVARNSVDWFFTTEDFVPGKGHSEDFNLDYSDLGYCFEGLYRADAINENRWKTTIDDWWANIEHSTWNPSDGLYGNTLGNGLEDHWSRGHGWWFETFPNVIDFYDRAEAASFREHFIAAAANVIALQDGIWHRDLEAPRSNLDASGGAMIASGLIRGFQRGDLGPEALASAFEALATLTEKMLQADGTLVGTDRHGIASPDPFPYTQEAYVRCARDLEVREIASLKKRPFVPTRFADGILITDLGGGTVTDVNGDRLSVDGPLLIKDLNGDGNTFRFLGVGPREVRLWNREKGKSYIATIQPLIHGSAETRTVSSDSEGILTLALDLAGEATVSLSPLLSESLWASLPVIPPGYVRTDAFGWIFDGYWPHVWTSRLGWIYVPPHSTLENLWFYSFTTSGWQWTHHAWDGWCYDPSILQWVQHPES